MNAKRVCIICRQHKYESEFNIEHIIPESIGNKKLIIKAVCKDCNSRLGEKVDCEITNNIISKLDKFLNKTKGKSGRIVNPFKECETIDGRIIYCDENLKPKLVPKVKYNSETGKLQISASSKEEAINIVNKKRRRLGKQELSNEEFGEIYRTSPIYKEQPILKIPITVDFNKIYIGFIKIAYEFMYYSIGEIYLEDKQGQKLAKILKDYIYDDIVLNIDIEQLQNLILKYKCVGKSLFKNENIHCINLVKHDNNIVANILLFSSFNYPIIVSDEPYEVDTRIYIMNPKDGELIIG